MGSRYHCILGKSLGETLEAAVEFYQVEEVGLIADYYRSMFGPTEHRSEVWYASAADTGYRTYFTYFKGPTAYYVTKKTLEFYNTGNVGSGFFNRVVLGPTEHAMEVWWSEIGGASVEGGFVSFVGKTWLETISKSNEFMVPLDAGQRNMQRTILGPGQHILDYMWG